MAFKSFALRNTTAAEGSFNRFVYTSYDDVTALEAVVNPVGGSIAYVIDTNSYFIYNETTDSWDSWSRTDNDQYLRSDGYQPAPSGFVSSFLEARAVAYGVNSINWAVPLVALADLDSGVADPTETVLVYSSDGPVSTISAGDVLVEGSTDFSFVHTNVPLGRWAYYTLFARYQSAPPDGADYYQQLASIEVLVPDNYQSVLQLWKRIPQHYRFQDMIAGDPVDPYSDFVQVELGALPDFGTLPDPLVEPRKQYSYLPVVGPLFKFLSIFGFEMDRMRTLINYVMVNRDPAIANVESLDAISRTVGLYLDSGSISVERLRAVLDDIGYLRRSTGTLDGVRSFLKAVSNCDVDFNTSSKTLTMYSQRVNYITSPITASTPTDDPIVEHRSSHKVEEQLRLYDRGSYDPTTYPSTEPPLLEGETAYAPGMYWQASASASSFNGFPVSVNDFIVAYDDGGTIEFAVQATSFSDTTYAGHITYDETVSTAEFVSGVGKYYTYLSGGDPGGLTNILFKVSSPIPVKLGDVITFAVHSGIGTSALRWVRLVDELGREVGRSQTLTVSPSKNGYPSAPAAQVTADNFVSSTSWTIAFVEFCIDVSSVPTYNLSYLLAERDILGGYFDGSITRGVTGDYRWLADKENDAVSLYTEEFVRTAAIVSSLYKLTLPVNQAPFYSVADTDAVPGWSAIVAYLASL